MDFYAQITILISPGLETKSVWLQNKFRRDIPCIVVGPIPWNKTSLAFHRMDKWRGISTRKKGAFGMH